MCDKSLMAPPNDDWEGASHDLKIEYDDSTVVMKGKIAEAHFANWVIPGGNETKSDIVVKTQSIRNPSDLNDPAYRELMIHLELAKFKFRGIAGFHGWFKSNGNRKSYGREYMNLILERADETLQQYITKNKEGISLKIYKSILFQLLFVLYETQQKCGFVHHDLHFKNIILKYLSKPDSTCFFEFNNQTFENTTGILLKLIDFGASRISIGNKVIYNSNNKVFGDLFNPSVDLIKIDSNLKAFKVDWSSTTECMRLSHKNLRQILRKNRDEFDWSIILGHSFFHSMICTEPLSTTPIRSRNRGNYDPRSKRQKIEIDQSN